MLSNGSWQLYSKTDPRWNRSGKGNVGLDMMPRKCKEKLEELKATLGNPPVDLKWYYTKDK